MQEGKELNSLLKCINFSLNTSKNMKKSSDTRQLFEFEKVRKKLNSHQMKNSSLWSWLFNKSILSKSSLLPLWTSLFESLPRQAHKSPPPFNTFKMPTLYWMGWMDKMAFPARMHFVGVFFFTGPPLKS